MKMNEIYSGYSIQKLDEEDFADFYNHYREAEYNPFNLYNNEYLILKDNEDNIVDKYKYIENKGSSYVDYISLESKIFGKIKPKDIFQLFALDSMTYNPVTLIGGPAGSGKSMLALGYLFESLERGKINKIIIFTNPVGARDCAQLGYYPGDVYQKMLTTQVGHVLCSKIGSIIEVERLIDSNQLEIIPAVDCRGYQIPPNCGCYILEAQNLTTDTLRMLLQRVSDDTKVIVDGDRFEQVDKEIYRTKNGMISMSNIFRGSHLFGQVDLKEIYRSEIGKLADKMR